MKLFWKLFCSMVSITILTCSVGGFLLIDGQFRASLDQEVQALYEEDDMLRYVLSLDAEGQVLFSQDDLSQLTKDVPPATHFRLSDGAGKRLGGSGDHLFGESLPLTGQLAENQRGWQLERIG